MVPFMPDRSEWHTPVHRIATRTKPGSVSTTSTLSSTSSVSSPMFRSTAARMIPPPVRPAALPGLLRQSVTGSTLAQMSETLGFWKIAQEDPGRLAIVDPDGTQTTYGELY